MPNTLQVRIRKFIKSIGQLKETLHDPNLEFGFRFQYPNKKGRTFIIAKPKKKQGIEIQTMTKISPEHLKDLNEDKQKELFGIISKFFMIKEIHHKLDFKNKNYGLVYHLHYEDDSEIKVNTLSDTIRRLFFIDVCAVGIIQEFSSGKFKSNGFGTPNFYS
ncbi:MAG: DUF2299 family protein [Promethearchaeia archaeon]